MIAKVTFAFVSMWVVVNSATCPTYTCVSSQTTGVNICALRASVTSAAIQLNRDGCSSGYACSATAILNWAGVGLTYPCYQVATMTTNVTSTGTSCGTQLASKNFKSGATSLLCSSSSDCLLADGTFSTCLCEMRSDGQGVCSAPLSNTDIYGSYWNQCGSANIITNVIQATYWSNFYATYALRQSDLTCLKIFAEIQAYIAAHSAYTSASVLAVSALFLLLG